MKDLHRKEAARRRAEKYAPAPVDTRLMYGVLAASMMLAAIIAVAAFYSVDLAPHVPVVAVLASVAFVAGLLVRLLRMSRHRRAHRTEYDGMGRSHLGQSGE